MTEHPGQEYLDAGFGPRERERLEAIEEAKRRPGSVWFEGPASSESRARASRKPDKPQGGSPVPGRAVSGTTDCACCGRAFAGRRRSARFCGELCRKRARRDRCGEAAA